MSTSAKTGKEPAVQLTPSQVVRRFADALDRAEYLKQRTEIVRRGRVAAVIVPPDDATPSAA